MKRGISPLIATVLLIGATIMIAAIVSTFIINQTKKFEPEKFMGESSYCQDVVLGTKEVNQNACGDIKQDCKAIENIALVNKGTFTIKAIDINADGLNGGKIDIETISGGSIKGLKPGRLLCTKRAECSNADDIALEEFGKVFTPGICKDKTVRIIPHISVEGKEIICTQSEMIINAKNSKCLF